MKNILSKTQEIIIEFFFPKICIFCGNRGEFLCKKCLSKKNYAKKIDPRTCFGNLGICENKSDDFQFCQNCKKKYQNQNLNLKGFISFFKHDEKNILTKTLYELKYNFKKYIHKEFSEIFFEEFENSFFKKFIEKNKNSEIHFVPVPISKNRLKWRSFNQSELFAKNIVSKLKSKNQKNIHFSNILKKKKDTIPQMKLSRKKRISNISDSFSLKKNPNPNLKEKPENKQTKIIIFIIDDVITTGSTISECEKILSKNFQTKNIEIFGISCFK